MGENATMQNDDDLFQGSGVQPNCTELFSLDLMEIFARTDIGKTEIWGSVSDAWLACFIVYYAVFSILLLITVCSYAYFFKTSSFSRMHHTYFICSVVLFQLRASRATD